MQDTKNNIKSPQKKGWTSMIDEALRQELNLSRDEYVILYYIFRTQNSSNKYSTIDGWCKTSVRDISKMLKDPKSNTYRNIQSLIKKGLIRTNESGRFRKATDKFQLKSKVKNDERNVLDSSQKSVPIIGQKAANSLSHLRDNICPTYGTDLSHLRDDLHGIPLYINKENKEEDKERPSSNDFLNDIEGQLKRVISNKYGNEKIRQIWPELELESFAQYWVKVKGRKGPIKNQTKTWEKGVLSSFEKWVGIECQNTINLNKEEDILFNKICQKYEKLFWSNYKTLDDKQKNIIRQRLTEGLNAQDAFSLMEWAKETTNDYNKKPEILFGEKYEKLLGYALKESINQKYEYST